MRFCLDIFAPCKTHNANQTRTLSAHVPALASTTRVNKRPGQQCPPHAPFSGTRFAAVRLDQPVRTWRGAAVRNEEESLLLLLFAVLFVAARRCFAARACLRGAPCNAHSCGALSRTQSVCTLHASAQNGERRAANGVHTAAERPAPCLL